MKTVAVVGASGFLGRAVFERLSESGKYNLRPLIHSSGNAWGLARLKVDLMTTDVTSKGELDSALGGCDYVVNCSRGSTKTMFGGLKNLLDTCLRKRVEHFVHISSTAVFGERFQENIVDETHANNASSGSYGWKKARQDQIIASAANRGLRTTILCPPNIVGPSSPYLLEIVGALLKGDFCFVEDGSMLCSVVDVRNLAQAIESFLGAGTSSHGRIIVSDDSPKTWQEFVEPLRRLLGIEQVPSIELNEATQLVQTLQKPKISMRRALLHLASPDVRTSLRKDPLWEMLHNGAASVARKLPAGFQSILRNSKEVRAPSRKCREYNKRLLAQQIRNVRFVSRLGSPKYRPELDSEKSSTVFSEWYRCQFGLDGDFKDLFGLLNQN